MTDRTVGVGNGTALAIIAELIGTPKAAEEMRKHYPRLKTLGANPNIIRENLLFHGIIKP